MNKQIYQTNAALGYQQYAFLIRLEKSENGHNYLCIGVENIPDDNPSYKVGEIVEDLEDFYVSPTDWTPAESPLKNNFFYNYWVENFLNKTT